MSELPEGWAQTTVGDVCEVMLGQSPPGSSYNSEGRGTPFFQGKAEFGPMYPNPTKWTTAPRKHARPGDVLLSVRAPVGPTNIAQHDCAIGRGLAALRPSAITTTKFVLYQMRATESALASMGSGTTFSAVSREQVRGHPFVLPPLAEQDAIVRVLDAVNDAVQLESEGLTQIQRVKATTMGELFSRGIRDDPLKESPIGPVPESWEVVEFGSIRESLQYGTSTRCSYDPTGFPVLRIPNIESGKANSSDLKYANLSPEDAARYQLRIGDLLFIRTNGVIDRLGSCAVYAGEPQGALFASYLIRAAIDRERLDPYFAAYFYGSHVGINAIASRATPAADGKYNLNTGTIDSLPVPVPSLAEQQDIVNVLRAIDHKIGLHRQKRVVLESTFNCLLNQLLTGQLRVEDLDASALTDVSALGEPAASPC